YVKGSSWQSALVMESSDDSGGFVVLEDDHRNKDGDPDWAVDGAPSCTAATATVVAGSTASIPLSCADSGPAYEQTPVTETVGCASCTPPANGSLSPVTQGEPSTVVYTPKAGFTG